LLITLLLCHEGTLREPLLYCSLYFKRHRQEYYSQLNAARTGDFERWIEFFATGIRISAEEATLTGQRVFAVFQEGRNRLRQLGRLAPTSLLVQEALQSKPLAIIATLTKATGHGSHGAHGGRRHCESWNGLESCGRQQAVLEGASVATRDTSMP
jgi:Fic family protein